MGSRAPLSLWSRALRALRESWPPPALTSNFSRRPRPPVRPLWLFDEKDALKRWIVASDEDIGGFSKASLTFVEEDEIPHMSLHGNLSTKVQGRLKRSGYAGTRSFKIKPALRLTDYTAFQVKVRADGRQYMCNVQAGGGYVKDDLFQHVFRPKRDQWTILEFPFQHFVFTNRGLVQMFQHGVDPARIQSLGFSLVDGIDGPFKLDVAWIKAVQVHDMSKRDAAGFKAHKAALSVAESGAVPKGEEDDFEAPDLSSLHAKAEYSDDDDVV